MSEFKTPYNMETEIDKVTLRDKAVDSIQMDKGLKFILGKLESIEDQKLKAKVLGEAGVYARILNKYDISQKLLEQSISLYETQLLNMNALVIQIRLTTLFYWQGKFDASVSSFTKIIHLIKGMNNVKANPLLAFAFQHFGKCRFEQKRYSEAMTLFSEAHQLRLIDGDLDLINSTQFAMEVTQKKIDQV